MTIFERTGVDLGRAPPAPIGLEEGPVSLAELNLVIAASPPFVTGSLKAVLGEGPVGAPIALVGEQPGDREDIEGRPFVGPAGQVLDKALEQAGIDRRTCYLTNAVKHFKFVERGRRRLHQKPSTDEIKHYRWWLWKELELVAPRLVVTLGATALQGVTGKPMSIMRLRGRQSADGLDLYVTVHPSYILRLPSTEDRERAFGAFVADLRQVHAIVAG